MAILSNIVKNKLTKNKMYYSKNGGLTLIEALIWFAVFSAILFSVMIIYKNSQAKANITLETKNIQFIFSGLQDAQKEGLSNDLNNETAANLGIIPRNIKKSSDGKFINSWGGDVVIEYVEGEGYRLTYKNVPEEDCVSLINQQKNVGWGKIESSTDDCVKFSNSR
jgi:type II secretory pathway pseudopilin PulG